MAWTDTARRQLMHNGPGYPSDLRDGEWVLIEPMFRSARSGGHVLPTCGRCLRPADCGYAGEKLRGALKGQGSWTLEIIKRSDTAKGLVLLPRRWVVERTFAWLGRCCRLANDWEKIHRFFNRMGPYRQHLNSHTQNRKSLNSLTNF